MTPEHWQQVKEILATALEKGSVERLLFLAEACHNDESLRKEVESLLAAYGEAESFLEYPLSYLLSEDSRNIREGGVLDRYRIIRQLGYGGMGAVYLAVRADDEFQRQVAIKLVRWQIDEDLVRRFRVERQILALLDHPNIARLYDGGTVEGRPYFVMELVIGEPIDRYCDSRRLPVRDRLNLFRTVCSAVHFAHQNLVVHRDLKPSNILVTPQGDIKLLDFGIAKVLEENSSVRADLTATGLLPMTPDYASPEQIRGNSITTASDIYSLGVVLYELLTGRRPHMLNSRLPEEIVRIIFQEPEKPSDVVTREVETNASDESQVTLSPMAMSEVREGDPAKLRRRLAGDVDNIVLMALRKEPERRYSSAAQFSEDIRLHLEDLPVLAQKDTFLYRAEKFIQRNKLAVATSSLVLLLVFCFLVSLAFQHQRTLNERDKAERIAEFLVQIFKISDPSESRGALVTAREVLDQGAQSIERQLAGQPETQAAMMNTLGEVYTSIGLYGRAEKLLTKALEIQRKHPGSQQVNIADNLDNLATVHALQGKYESAERMYHKSLILFRKTLGDQHPRTAETLNNYGALLLYRGNYAEAEPILRETLEKLRQARGDYDEKVAVGLSNLASLLRIKGEYQEARRLLEESLRIRRKLYGDEHPSVAMTLNNIGLLLTNSGDRVAAKPFYLEALRLRRKVFGNEHPQVATSLHNLAAVYEDLGELDAAEQANREALGILRKSLGSEHPSVASGLNQLANLQRRRGNLEEAERTFRESLAIRRKLLPVKHRDIAVSLNNLAVVLQDKGEYAEAEQLYYESLRLRRELWGPGHRDVAVALNNIGTLREDMGDLREAEQFFRDALAIRRRVLGNKHPDVLASLGNLASALSARGKNGEAETLVREALQIARRSGPGTRLLVAQLESVLGECLLRLGHYVKAEPLLVASYSAIRAGFGDRARPTQKVLRRIVELYRALNRPEKTREYGALLAN